MKAIRTICLISAVIGGGMLTACSQVAPNPTVYSCPSSAGTAYAAITTINSPTAIAYTDSKPGVGTYCYIAQSINSNSIPAAVSVPSNIVGPFTLTAANSVILTWTDPTTGLPPTGYTLSRAAAVSSTIIAPTLGTGTVASAPSNQPTVAQSSSMRLTGKISGD